MNRSTEVDGLYGLLRVDQSWCAVVLDIGTVVKWVLTSIDATLDGERLPYPRSAELADTYATTDPEFRAWLDYQPPADVLTS